MVKNLVPVFLVYTSKGNWNTLLGGNSFKMFCFPTEKGSSLEILSF